MFYNKKTIRMAGSNGSSRNLIVVVMVVGLTFGAGTAYADFVFGEPSLLDEPVNYTGSGYFDCISADGLELYVERPIDGKITSSEWDIYVSTRETTDDPWSIPVRLGPTVNSDYSDVCACLSGDGLELYFHSNRPSGHGRSDIWVATRPTRSDPWATPENLGPTINTPDHDGMAWITPDGLELYFSSVDRPGGYGGDDIWVATRASTNDEWGEPENLGPVVNSPADDCHPCLSPDGLVLFFSEWDSVSGPWRPGGLGRSDMWMTRRKSTADPWEPPVNLGPDMNTSEYDSVPRISPDGSMLYFTHGRYGALFSWGIWQAPIIPIVDFNGDGEVNHVDMGMLLMLGWGTNNSRYDIGPTPLGDGIVDSKDLMVLAEHGVFLAGDVNYDGVVDFFDLAEVAKNWLRQQP